MSPKTRKYLIIPLLILIALAVVPHSVSRVQEHGFQPGLRCVIALEGQRKKSPDARMNYALVQRFAEQFHLDADIHIRDGGEGYLDSLKERNVDLVVMYRPDSIAAEGIFASRPFNNSTVWVLRDGDPTPLKMVNTWLRDISGTEYFRRLRAGYLRGGGTVISPYDDLIKGSAVSIGWDWRLLSSLIYHESHFIIDASSDKGAVGLMQIHSDRYSVDTLLDPAVNLSIGTQYLDYLDKMFANQSTDSVQHLKFILAAYNAGEGNILKCIRYAEEHGVDASRWENIVDIIPEVPGFHGAQTIAYVDSVLNTFAEYAVIYER